MQALRYRHIQDGNRYEHLFPAATGIIKTIKTDATVGDTLSFIKKVVPETLHQTEKFAAEVKGRNTHESCRNIWNFVYRHIRYRKDKDGYEQVRSPRRSWQDRDKGVDCDCYTTFISSILYNLRIPHVLRITKYGKPNFQHIYPIVPTGNRYITLDCVTDHFNYEVPYTEKRDVIMDLQYLDGLNATPYNSAEDRIIDGLDGDEEFGELGLFGRKKKKKQAAEEDPLKNMDAVPGTGKKKKKGFFRKVLNVANKLNPATLLLRNGVLVAMKLNIGKIGSRLRWSYLSPRAAQAKGIDLQRYVQLVKTRQKLEDIFSNAGGNPGNMKKAILKGKGNKDHAVNGLLGLGALYPDENIMSMNVHTPLPQLLGEIYYDENVRGMEGFAGFGELGEPVTLATVAAASSVIAAIAASLKKIGDIFKGKKTEGSEDFSEQAAAAAGNDVEAVKDAVPAAAASNPAVAEAAAITTVQNSGSTLPTGSGNDSGPAAVTTVARSASTGADPGGTSDPGGGDDDTTTTTTTGNKAAGSGESTGNKAADDKKGFWDKNKTWLIPVGIGVAGIGIYKMMNKPAPVAAPRSHALNGVPKRKNYKRKTKGGRGSRGKHRGGGRKTPIALM